MKLVPLLATASLLLFAGCGTSTPETPQVLVTEDETEVSVEQFAGRISPIKNDIDSWIADWEEATCSSLAVSRGATDCAAYATAGAFTAQAAYMQLDTLTNTDAPGYFGQPPAELEDLYQRTLDTASATNDVADTYLEVECPDTDECTGAVFDLATGMEDLASALSEWDPYL